MYILPKFRCLKMTVSFSLYAKVLFDYNKKIKPKEKCKGNTHYRMLTSNPLLILTCSLCWSPNK